MQLWPFMTVTEQPVFQLIWSKLREIISEPTPTNYWATLELLSIPIGPDLVAMYLPQLMMPNYKKRMSPWNFDGKKAKIGVNFEECRNWFLWRTFAMHFLEVKLPFYKMTIFIEIKAPPVASFRCWSCTILVQQQFSPPFFSLFFAHIIKIIARVDKYYLDVFLN